ncbi:hypothetical protein AB0Q95_43500 [Streptomyces sp. NPDC059900]|uniref:hypothetical protein n=1 Tax=Streptomyces sp. NPDC059900 TaxID=3155816 RepID=UPI00342F01F5
MRYGEGGSGVKNVDFCNDPSRKGGGQRDPAGSHFATGTADHKWNGNIKDTAGSRLMIHQVRASRALLLCRGARSGGRDEGAAAVAPGLLAADAVRPAATWPGDAHRRKMSVGFVCLR